MSGKISSRKVNPTGPLGAKILVVGEAPGADEDSKGIPFVGRSGEILWDAFKRYGVKREDVRVTNLCNYRPENNIFEILHNSSQLEEGITELEEYIKKYPPNVIAAVGGIALDMITYRTGILAHRSSILPCRLGNQERVKVVPTIHPAHLFRTPESYLFFDFDIHRVVDESHTPEFNYTPRAYILVKDYLTQNHIDVIYSTGEIAIDIESVIDKESDRIVPITISFSPDKHRSVAVVWNNHNFPLIKGILEDATLTKFFHFGYCFDIELLYIYGINVVGTRHDTYLMSQVLDPTLPRSLGFLTTTYTREPYYKKSGRDSLPEDTKVWGAKTSRDDVLIYNAKDTAVTIEIAGKLINILRSENKWDKYQFKLRCAEKAQIISRNGMLIDEERRSLFQRSLLYKWTRMQQVLNMMANRTVNVNTNQGKNSIAHLLYDELGLPARRDRKGKLKADEKALLSLVAYCQGEVETKRTDTAIGQWTIKREIVKTIIDIRQLRKLISSYIDINLSVDGRARSVYNVGGAETGRWAAMKYVDRTGYNGMTTPRGDVHIPDDLPEGELDPKLIIEQLRKEMQNETESEEEE